MYVPTVLAGGKPLLAYVNKSSPHDKNVRNLVSSHNFESLNCFLLYIISLILNLKKSLGLRLYNKAYL